MPATGLNPAGRRRARKATAAAHLQGHEPEESRKRKRSDRGTPQLSATPSRDDTAASSTDGLDASAVPACRQLMSSPAACAAFHERQSRGAARAALGERMRVSTFIKVSRKEKIDDQKVGDPVLGKLYAQAGFDAPAQGPTTPIELQAMDDMECWPLIRIGDSFKIEIQSKMPCTAGEVTIVEETPTGRIGLHTRSRWWSSSAGHAEVEQQVEIAYWEPEARCLVCFMCGRRVVDPTWYADDGAAGAGEPCKCNDGNDLLIKATLADRKAPFLHRHGSTTTLYCQLRRERADGRNNEWLKGLPRPFEAGKRFYVERTMAIKVTEIARQEGRVLHNTVYTGHVRLGSKTGCLNLVKILAEKALARVRERSKLDEKAAAAAAVEQRGDSQPAKTKGCGTVAGTAKKRQKGSRQKRSSKGAQGTRNSTTVGTTGAGSHEEVRDVQPTADRSGSDSMAPSYSVSDVVLVKCSQYWQATIVGVTETEIAVRYDTGDWVEGIPLADAARCIIPMTARGPGRARSSVSRGSGSASSDSSAAATIPAASPSPERLQAMQTPDRSPERERKHTKTEPAVVTPKKIRREQVRQAAGLLMSLRYASPTHEGDATEE